jgi:ABC-type Fe3+ transport system permease subunit
VTDHDNGSGRAVAKLFGALLMAVGGLMAGLCGLCSAGVVVMSGANGVGGAAPAMMLALIFGGPPIVIGVGVFLGGRSLWRGPKPSKPTAPSA